MAAKEAPSPAGGRLRLLGPDGGELEAADAAFEPQDDALVVHPKQQPLLRVDFADVDALALGDYVFALQLATGERVEASMLGRRFGEISSATAAALTAYQAKNLLLEEPVGGEPFACDVARAGAEGAAEVRVYATSLAVLPKVGVPYGLPFGEVDAISFDEGRYAIDLKTGEGTVSLLRLGKRTQPCLRLLESRVSELRSRAARALAHLVPDLPSLLARRFAQAMRDGVPVPRSALDALHPDLWPALVRGAIAEKSLRESFEALAARCAPGAVSVGLKETNARQDADEAPDTEPAPEGEPPAEQPPPEEPREKVDGEDDPMAGRVVWFAFPIYSEDRKRPGNAVAVEAVTRGGRATYFFRIAPPQTYAEASADELATLARDRVRSVSRALVALTFKREPIYLPDEKIRTGAYARYRLALRLSAPLKASRATFVGRAIHGAGWSRQVEAALARAIG